MPKKLINIYQTLKKFRQKLKLKLTYDLKKSILLTIKVLMTKLISIVTLHIMKKKILKNCAKT